MNQEQNMRKSYMGKILNKKKKITKGCIKREKCLNMIEKFCQQIQFALYLHMSYMCLCYTCQKHISRNEIRCQAVFNKMSLRF